MKIEDKRHKCFFHELMQGEVFVNLYGAVFMKTNDVEVRIGEEGDVCPYITFNAVFLESGELAHFIDEDEVQPINAMVLLEDKEDERRQSMKNNNRNNNNKMFEIKFKYRDKYNWPNWSEQSGTFASVSECIKFYGLGVDCEYEIISVKEVD